MRISVSVSPYHHCVVLLGDPKGSPLKIITEAYNARYMGTKVMAAFS